MPKEAKETITNVLEVEPILINSALFSAQSRKRLYWTNIPFVNKLLMSKKQNLRDLGRVLLNNVDYMFKNSNFLNKEEK